MSAAAARRCCVLVPVIAVFFVPMVRPSVLRSRRDPPAAKEMPLAGTLPAIWADSCSMDDRRYENKAVAQFRHFGLAYI